MAGLPAGSETDTTPNWITSTVSWPDFMAPAYEYQWKVTIEFWNEFIAHCKKCGIEHIAIEEFPGTMVWSASTLLKLREATDDARHQLDPSHMMVLGADPIAAARALKAAFSTFTARMPASSAVWLTPTVCSSLARLPSPLTVYGTTLQSAAARTSSGGRNSSPFAT